MSAPLRYPASYSPFVLQSQITVQPAGEMGLADPTRLENPFQGPMWIDEIRFRVPEGRSQYASLYCKLKLGELPLTQGNVPVCLLGKALNDEVEGDGFGANTAPRAFTWRLPKPLFVPARELLRPTLYFAPFSGAAAITATVAYACRPLPVGTPTPRVLQVPWVAAYVPPMQATSVAGGDRVDVSQPSDLYNPWDQDLHVQRFVGRLMVQDDDLEEFTRMSLVSSTPDFEAGLPTSGTSQMATSTLVSAQDSQNNILIRDPTPFAHVFNFVDRAWTVNCILPPKGFYQFTVERFWAGYSTVVNPAITATTGISMVGWREVPYAP